MDAGVQECFFFSLNMKISIVLVEAERQPEKDKWDEERAYAERMKDAKKESKLQLERWQRSDKRKGGEEVCMTKQQDRRQEERQGEERTSSPLSAPCVQGHD